LPSAANSNALGADGKKSYPVEITSGTEAMYYARGAGPLPLDGPEDYSVFSKAVIGDEATFGKKPEDILYFGERVSKFRGREISYLPIAVALWRYV
jgi:hypothetical protein